MRRAFSLIELMVVVAITLTLVGVGVVSASRFLAREHLLATKSEVLSSVKLARNYAVTNQSPGYTSQLDLVALTVNASGQLSVWPVNLDSGSGPSIFTKNLGEEGTSLSRVNYGELLFSVPEGKLLLSDGIGPVNTNYVVTILISSTEGIAETAAISVDSGGKIW